MALNKAFEGIAQRLWEIEADLAHVRQSADMIDRGLASLIRRAEQTIDEAAMDARDLMWNRREATTDDPEPQSLKAAP